MSLRTKARRLRFAAFVLLGLAGAGGSAQAASFQAVAAGYDHTCAIRAGGPVSCWGSGAQNQLGVIGATRARTPLAVIGTYTAIQLAAGQAYWCALLTNTTVTCAGAGTHGEIGNGTAGNAQYPQEVSGLRGVTRIAAGTATACAISAGTVFCWGDGARGQLGDGQLTFAPQPTARAVAGVSGATDLAVGTSHACALAGGRIFCWGETNDGKLGTANTAPIAFAGDPVVDIADASGVAAGTKHTCAIRSGGIVWCWGSSDTGQLGIGGGIAVSGVPRPVQGLSGVTQISALTDTTCALRGDGTVWCWGRGDRGQLGNGTLRSSNIPVQVAGLSGATSIGVGSAHSCATTNDRGATYCWGTNLEGELGSGSSIGPGAKETTPQLVQDSPRGIATFVPTPLTEQETRSSGGLVDLRLIKVRRRGGRCPAVAEITIRARGREVRRKTKDVEPIRGGCLVTGKFALPAKTQRAFTVIYLVRGQHLRTIKHRLRPRNT